MIVIVSPTKTMKEVANSARTLPLFRKKSFHIIEVLKTYGYKDLMQLMKVNETIAHQNVERYQHLMYNRKGSAAILTYKGLQYQHIGADEFNEAQQAYAQEHIRILSGLYGMLLPFDSIYPYRLEMQCKLEVENCKNLYEYWMYDVSKQILKEMKKHKEQVIVNIASNEYANVLNDTCKEHTIDIVFQVEKNGKRKVEGTAAKMARGKMIRYIVEKEVDSVEDLKKFMNDDFVYRSDLSTSNKYIFVKTKEMNE